MVVQGRIRRFGAAVVIALAMAFVLVAVKHADAQHVPSMCKDLTPSDWEYWARQCWMYPSNLHPPFLVRVR